MKKKYPIALLMFLTLHFVCPDQIKAQEKKEIKIGKSSDFIRELKKAEPTTKTASKSGRNLFKLDLKGNLAADLKQFSKVGDGETFTGYLGQDSTSNVNITIENEIVSGTIISPKQKKAYRYKTISGELYLEETDIDSLICTGHGEASSVMSTNVAAAAVSIPLLESNPGAPAVVYLDFDGEYVVSSSWNGGNPIDALPSDFSVVDIVLAYIIISEDYAPFNINITTKRSVYDATPAGKRNMCIFTPTKTAAPEFGGVAQVNSFTWTSFAPSWVFNRGGKSAGESGSHEIGHVMGLQHDGINSTATTNGDYYDGHSNKIWGTIMGSSHDDQVVQWSKGEYQNANNTYDDDLSIIGGIYNKFGFVKDEAGGSLGTARYLNFGSTGSLSNNTGIISKTSDLDIFRFKTNGGNLNITLTVAGPISVDGVIYPTTNLDAKMELLNSSGTVIVSSNPAGTGNPSISRSLAAGTYYLRIDGVGTGNPLTDGYSDYASLGRYTLTGTVGGAVSENFISIIEPENNATFYDAATITIKPSFKSTGTITKIEYFEGTTKLGESTSSPSFAFSKSNFTEGSHTIYAKATNSAGVTFSSGNITISTYKSIPAETSGNFENGMVYNYYEGTYTDLPNFSTSSPVFSGLVYQVSIDNSLIPRYRSDNFAIRYKGYIQVLEEGLYSIALSSDDGSKLFLGNKLIIDHGGLHAATTKYKTVYIKQGFVPFELQYFESTGGETLSLTLTNLSTNNVVSSGFYRKNIPIAWGTFVQEQMVSGVKYEYNEGDYNLLPTNFNSLTYKSIGVLNNFTTTIPNRRADNFAVRYSGYIDIPRDGEWIFYLKSDEGSKLYINDQLRIAHDGIHTAATEKTSKTWLGKGNHKIRIEYFEKTGTESLTLSYSGPGTRKQTVPGSRLLRRAVNGEKISYLNSLPLIPGTIHAEYYDQGGEGYGYHDLTAGNQFGLFRTDDVDVTIEPSGGQYMVSGVQSGEWLEYMINSTGSGTYDVQLRVGSGSSTSSLKLSSSNTGRSYTIPIPAITNGQQFQTIIFKNVLVGTGNRTLRLTANATCNIDYLQFFEPGTLRQGSDEEVVFENVDNRRTIAFPNPFDTRINIDLARFDKVEHVKILDSKGLVLWQADASLLNQDMVTVEENFISGMYLVEIKADDFISRIQLIKIH